jgi:hypothetical protein
MAATWDASLASPRDRARLALGDTGLLKDGAGQAIWLLQNETLDALLAGGYNEGVALAAEALIAQFSQLPDRLEEQEGLIQEWGERIAAWRDLAARMRSGMRAGQSLTVGGRTASASRPAPPAAEDLT